MNQPACHVLIIEDNPAEARWIQVLLAEVPAVAFTSETASYLKDALKLLESTRFDLVIVDLSLPDSQGLDTFQAVYAAANSVPVVVLTGLADEQVALRALELGAQDYLVKGQHQDEDLVRTVRYSLERYRSNEQLRQREAQMRMLTEQLPASFWTTDLELRFTSCSASGFIGLDLSVEELVDTGLVELFGNLEREAALIDAHQEAVEGRSAPFDIRCNGRMYHGHVEPFRHVDGSIMGTIGVALDITEKMLVELELRVTRKVQAGLRPDSAPNVTGWDVAGASYAADAAGGDYYDYIRFQDGATGLVVCDVGGNGLGPSLLMAQTRAYLQALAESHLDPGDVLTRVNRFLHTDSNEQRLVALFVAQIQSDSRQLRYAAAGHRSYLLRQDGECLTLGSTGIPLNILPDAEITTSARLEVQAGDVLLMYTDGIVECLSPEDQAYTTQRMLDLVKQMADAPAKQIVQTLFADVREFAEQSTGDDMTALIARVV